VRRPWHVFGAFHDAIAHAERHVTDPRAVRGPAYEDERLPAEIQLETPRDADAQIGLRLERFLRGGAGTALVREEKTGLELHGATRHEPGALGLLGAIGLDLFGERDRHARENDGGDHDKTPHRCILSPK
jgi:hypothetical protein